MIDYKVVNLIHDVTTKIDWLDIDIIKHPKNNMCSTMS